MTKADGKGKWWEGYDPQDLYAQRHPLSQDTWDNGAVHRQWAWGGGATQPTQDYIDNFFNRTDDAIIVQLPADHADKIAPVLKIKKPADRHSEK